MLGQILLFIALSSLCAQADTVASLKAGKIQGASCSGSKANSYLGIPFAKPPIGNLRFAPPLTYDGPFSGGSLNATVAKPACEQFGDPKSVGSILGSTSEDCLYLNVFAPASANQSSKLPVKVFIYGGSFINGGNNDPLYNGCNLASDAIVVTLSYRLGPLGFLAIEGTSIAGNQGLQDVLMGAQWVQDNIAAFGGDPEQVLVFGESAGASLTWIMSTMSSAPSLMKAALAESRDGALFQYNTTYYQQGQQYAQALGCNLTDIACFQSKSVRDLTSAQSPSTGLSLTPSGWEPFVDGKIIPVQPETVPPRVPFLAGTNADEGTLFVISYYGSPQNVTEADYTNIISIAAGQYAQKLTQAYPLSSYNTSSTNTPLVGNAPFYALSQLFTDYRFKCPTRRTLNLTTLAKVPAYTYLNSHPPKCSWEQSFPAKAIVDLGTTHSSELQFVFNQSTKLPLPKGNCTQTEQEQEISQTLANAWTSMATHGNPGSVGGEAWPLFSLQNTQGLLVDNGTKIGAIDYTVCDEIWDPFAAFQLQNATASAQNGTATSGLSASASGSKTSASIGNRMGLWAVGPWGIVLYISAMWVASLGL